MLTLAQLERHLLAATDILRGSMDPSGYKDCLLGLLFMKQTDDEFAALHDRLQAEALGRGATAADAKAAAGDPANYHARGALFVPPEARWAHISGGTEKVLAQYLQPALDALGAANPHLSELFGRIDFTRIGGRGGADKQADRRLKALIDHFSTVSLRGDDFEYPDLIGAAYEYLIKQFTDSKGGKTGEFFTPPEVGRLLVELARPQPGSRVYDPCMGSGGLLIQAQRYVEEYGGAGDRMTLAGQDANPGAWVMAVMNLLFHGASHEKLRIGDVLTDPQHGDDFDLVLANPPYAMDYQADDLAEPEVRMPWGRAPERGKADLMFVQHMLHAVGRRQGRVFVVVPHGVLFRGSGERDIRTRLLDADALEAVIGLPENLFYNTAIPTCVLVLRAPGSKRDQRQGHVLFINAARKFLPERVRNRLMPEHVEHIASAFHAGADEPGFARLVPRAELAANDDNLNIRRYVDDSPPPEPQDVQAHLTGGVPRSEVAAHEAQFAAWGIDPTDDLFTERPSTADYLDFLPEAQRPTPERIRELSDTAERTLWDAFSTWWTEEGAKGLAELLAVPDSTERRGGLLPLREDLKATLAVRLATGPVTAQTARGVVAAWWEDSRRDVVSLVHNGARGVISAWMTDIHSQLLPAPDRTGKTRRPSGERRRAAYEHPLLNALVPRWRDALAQADTELTAIEAEQRAAGAADGDDAENVTPELRAQLKKARAEAAARVAALEADLWPTEPGQSPLLEREVWALRCFGGEDEMVLSILRSRLETRLRQHLDRSRSALYERYMIWHDKYAVSLRDAQQASDEAHERMVKVLAEMGYAY